ncbi:MAG: hypothetical protein WC791_04495 [Candidatus Paceibacterota bacterium]|jgi:hypothetical protein
MYRTIDLLTLQKAIEVGANEAFHYTSFTNAINEYVFKEKHNWFVDTVVPYFTVSLADGNIVRVARVHVVKDQKRLFLYVIAMSNAKALHSWELLGTTALMEGVIKEPDYETINWFWRPLYLVE